MFVVCRKRHVNLRVDSRMEYKLTSDCVQNSQSDKEDKLKIVDWNVPIVVLRCMVGKVIISWCKQHSWKL